MAKKPPKVDADPADADDMPPDQRKKRDSHKKLLEEALKNYKLDVEADRENRNGYIEDMKFTLLPGEQWTAADKADRGKDRPMYEFNELRIKCKNTINHIRANRPAVKIRGVEEGDKDLAEIRQGLFLNIWNNSDADSVTDYAATHQVVGGMGAMRVDTEYADDSVSEQNIKISAIMNPMCVLADRSARDELKRDAKHWLIFTKIPNDDFDAKYPNADRVSFELDAELEELLNDDASTWVAEYWKKVPTVKHLCLLSNGKTIDKGDPKNAELPEGVMVVKERKVNTHKIVQYIISGNAVLEGPNDWAGKEFPFVLVYGEYVIVDGKVTWHGLPRFGKDAQRAHNWAMTSVFESIASSSQAKDWATPAQALGHTSQWAEAAKKNWPFQLYNPDPQSPGPPARRGGADVPVALMQAAQMSSAAMNNTVGITLANEGRVSNETSGKAIRARQDEGMVATYNFGDNMGKSVRRIAEIVMDLQPHIYDTERNLRILGHDGSEKYVKINTPGADGRILNDLSIGKFDIVVTIGPSFATQRQEAAEFYTSMAQSNPALSAVAGDLIVKAQDYPMSDAIAERLRLTLPPPILAALNKDKPLPPEVQAAMQQAEMAMQQVQEQGAMVQQAAQEAQTEKAGADKAKSDVQLQVAQLKIQEANLAKSVADFQKMVAETQLKIAQLEQAKEDVEADERAQPQERAELSQQLDQALMGIKQEAAELMANYAQQLAHMQMQMHMASQQQAQPPRQRQYVTERRDGKLYTTGIDQPMNGAGAI